MVNETRCTSHAATGWSACGVRVPLWWVLLHGARCIYVAGLEATCADPPKSKGNNNMLNCKVRARYATAVSPDGKRRPEEARTGTIHGTAKKHSRAAIRAFARAHIFMCIDRCHWISGVDDDVGQRLCPRSARQRLCIGGGFRATVSDCIDGERRTGRNIPPLHRGTPKPGTTRAKPTSTSADPPWEYL